MVRELISLLYLSVAGLMDYKKRTVPVMMPIIGAVVGVFLYLYQKDMPITELLIAIIPGVIFVAISILSSGKVGLGDGLIIIPFGLMVGLWDSTTSLIYAMLSSGVVALFLLATKKKSGNYQLPFLPFLLCGLVLTLFTNSTY